MARDGNVSSMAADVYAALAMAFAAPACSSTVKGLRSMLQLLGVSLDERKLADLGNECLFYERFVVPGGPHFVSLRESVLLSTSVEAGAVLFSARYRSEVAHVRACYERFGFIGLCKESSAPALPDPCPDALSSELAFMAFLRRDGYDRAADEFLEAHLSRWVEKAAAVLRVGADDAYAWLGDIVAAWVRLDGSL